MQVARFKEDILVSTSTSTGAAFTKISETAILSFSVPSQKGFGTLSSILFVAKCFGCLAVVDLVGAH